MDMNTAKLKKNAFRVTKERGKTASRIRIPGGHMDARFLAIIQEIAEKYGNGTVHITNRQGFEVPGIDFEDMPKVNALLQSVIEGLEIEYVSQIALAQKAGALTSVQSYVAFCGQLSAINPNDPNNPTDNIDRDKTARMFSRMLGVPEEVNRDPKDVAKQRKAAQDALAQQAQQAQLAQVVDAADKIGSIPVDDAHAGGIVKGLM